LKSFEQFSSKVEADAELKARARPVLRSREERPTVVQLGASKRTQSEDLQKKESIFYYDIMNYK
jgi:hypothetical protein